LRANFTGRDLTDTVYVTANPQLERHRNDWDVQLHEVVNVWLDEGWDNTTGTVLAETMTEVAIDAADRFPDKRLAVHYMQPHYPFVRSDTTFDKQHLASIDDGTARASEENVWEQKFGGNLSVPREELWSMYVDNLTYVLNHLKHFLDELTGKSVVTSDHGNYVGERSSPLPIREYGHPRGLYDDTLVRVPWLECESNERRDIGASSAAESSERIESAVVSERLRDLGYRE
jgi:arylsulfatase A-like enzyme